MTCKIRKILCGIAAAGIVCASLCGCASDDAGVGGTTSGNAGTSTSSSTMPAPAGTESSSAATENSSAATGSTDKDNDDDNENGDYDADSDGQVNDDDKDGDSDDNKKDEAAMASSYMDIAAGGLSITKIGWGLGRDRDKENRPIDAVKAEERYKDLGGRFLTEGKRICLTFDEGYENGYTEKILDVLKEKNVKAIFFVTYDYCRTSPELIKRMIREGHTVGNHTYTHPSMPDCSLGEMTEEVQVLHNYVLNHFDYEMELFRFPKGEFSENALDVVHKLGYTSLFWSFAYSDWDTSDQPDPAEALRKIKDSTHSGIYLLHAVSSTNAEILGDVIDYWRKRGFEVGAEL